MQGADGARVPRSRLLLQRGRKTADGIVILPGLLQISEMCGTRNHLQPTLRGGGEQ
jgi:hypothetical protein